jgi:glycosyltransferase involved in cell wall biosynthesis
LFLKGRYPFAEIVIADQSRKDSIKQIAAKYSTKGFIRYFKSKRSLSFSDNFFFCADKAIFKDLLVLPVEIEIQCLDYILQYISNNIHKLNKKIIFGINNNGEKIKYVKKFASGNELLKTILYKDKKASRGNRLCFFCQKDDFKIYQNLNTLSSDRSKLQSISYRKKHPDLKKANDYQKAEKKVKELRYKLFNLGFTSRAYMELNKIAIEHTNSYIKRLAARELAVWHANSYNNEGAKRCINWLNIAKNGEEDSTKLRQSSVLEAECYGVLGQTGKALKVLEQALKKEKHADLYLARANLELHPADRLVWINRALSLYGISEVTCKTVKKGSFYDGLKILQSNINKSGFHPNGPKVTVIIPAFNAQDTIQIALDSVLNQTWKNLEVLVVDDCSTDSTVRVVQGYEQKDRRVRLIRTERNEGPYVARNIALSQAKGKYVTVNDADDWSHPKKIEIQVLNLLKQTDYIANTSQYSRVFPDLKFYRRGNYGTYIIKNYSSLLFCREPVLKTIGYWDCVRFGADADYIERVQKVFGINNLETGPLLFAGQSPETLTSDKAFGVPGYIMGCRLEYQNSRRHFYNSRSSLYFEFPCRIRPFPVPEPMLPVRKARGKQKRHFDLVFAADFRKTDSVINNSINELGLLKKRNIKTGLVHIPRYELNAYLNISAKVRNLTDQSFMQLLVYGEKVSCDLLIIRDNRILRYLPEIIPEVKAKEIWVVVNEVHPMISGQENSVLSYIDQCNQNLEIFYSDRVTWYPSGETSQDILLRLDSVRSSTENWQDVFDEYVSGRLRNKETISISSVNYPNIIKLYAKSVGAQPQSMESYLFASKFNEANSTTLKVDSMYQSRKKIYPDKYLKEITPENVRNLYATILRTGSLKGRDLVAWYSSKGALSYSDIIEGLKSTQDTYLKFDSVSIANKLDPDSAIGLAYIMAAQSFDNIDKLNSLKLFQEIIRIHGFNVVKPVKARFFSDLAIFLKKYETAKSFLDSLKFKPEDRRFIECDLLNPFLSGCDQKAWLSLFNEPFLKKGLEPVSLGSSRIIGKGKFPFDQLSSLPEDYISEGPLVSVIISAWNPSESLLASVDSILNQSWRNLEIILIDDCSSDSYEAIFKQCLNMDSRIKIIRHTTNQGTYVARNNALKIAKGDFVTFQDSDDYSHPRRIEMQVEHMKLNKQVVGCQCSTLRTDENLSFSLPGRPSIQLMAWSLFYRRKQVLTRIGYFDPVRKGADNEYIRRMNLAFDCPVSKIDQRLPLGIYRTTSASLSGQEFKPGWKHPARKSYQESYNYWHMLISQHRSSPYLDMPDPQKRFFPAPLRFVSNNQKKSQKMVYDFVIVADWRNNNCLQQIMYDEIKVLIEENKKVAICHLESFRLITKHDHQKTVTVQDLIHRGQVHEVILEDPLQIRSLILRQPEVFLYPPHVNCCWEIDKCIMIEDETSFVLGTEVKEQKVDCINNVKNIFGKYPDCLFSSNSC